MFLLSLAPVWIACASRPAADPDAARLEQAASRVTVIRDDWGIAHVYGQTDADAVFGMIYAQAEDDFNRVETNYLNAMGRLAEAEGEGAVFQDLRMKLFIDPDQMKADYGASPEWLKLLMNAWADGLNFYLLKHPDVHPRVIRQFEPWMALTFSEGSIGGDIEGISLPELEAFYGKGPKAQASEKPAFPPEPTGSNGIAIAPGNTANHRSLLLINPHTSFFFRSELQAVSEEGLNVYGAVTWGQIFVYQGFNDRVGWMHTSSGVDAVDEYAETIVPKGDSLFYKYGSEERPITVDTITVPYRAGATMSQKSFAIYRTHHGPVVREADGKWIAVRLMQEPVKALIESYSRTKAKTYEAFRETVDLRTNSSNNTVYADADGNIAYFQASFIPRRDPQFDWTKPVDGSSPATEWQGLLSLEEMPNLYNPSNGWIQNTNNWPYSAAGGNSPKAKDFPRYVDTYEENPRGIHAIQVLKGKKDFTLPSLIGAAYDSYQPAFALLIPPLLRDWDHLPAADPLKDRLAAQVKLLRDWDYRWSAASVPTSLAVFWGEDLWRRVSKDAESEDLSVYQYMATRATARQRLEALAAASDKLGADFGAWKTPWGEINRFQRLTDDIEHRFSDSGPSIPVSFTSARWGSLASFGARPYQGSKKLYGTYGNSFVAVIEFGDSVRARAITAGGQSGDPGSKHFNDQADRYSRGDLRDVYFYRAQLAGHTEREYHPGE
jgi:acyl-homoserine-lactone acylase